MDVETEFVSEKVCLVKHIAVEQRVLFLEEDFKESKRMLQKTLDKIFLKLERPSWLTTFIISVLLMLVGTQTAVIFKWGH